MSRLLNPLLSLVDKVIIGTSNLTFVILNLQSLQDWVKCNLQFNSIQDEFCNWLMALLMISKSCLDTLIEQQLF